MTSGHNVLKGIFEIPKAIEDTLKLEKDNIARLSIEIAKVNPKLIFISGHTNSFIGIGAKYAFEELIGIPTIPILPNDLINYESAISKEHCVVLVSDTGNSPGPVAAAKYLDKKGILNIAITNTKNSRLEKSCKRTIVTHAFHEAHAIPGHNAILATLYQIAINIAKEQGKIDIRTVNEFQNELYKTPEIVRFVLNEADKVKDIAQACKDDKDLFIVGGGPNYATAIIGGWLLGECAGLHGIGLDVDEVVHGPLYTGYSGMPLIAIAQDGKNFEKIVKLIDCVKDIGLKIIVLSNKEAPFKSAFRRFVVPANIHEMFTPLCYIAPVELFVYYSAIARGRNPDVLPNFDILKNISRLQ